MIACPSKIGFIFLNYCKKVFDILNMYASDITEGRAHSSDEKSSRCPSNKLSQCYDWEGHRPPSLLSVCGVQIPGGGLSIPVRSSERAMETLNQPGIIFVPL